MPLDCVALLDLITLLGKLSLKNPHRMVENPSSMIAVPLSIVPSTELCWTEKDDLEISGESRKRELSGLWSISSCVCSSVCWSVGWTVCLSSRSSISLLLVRPLNGKNVGETRKELKNVRERKRGFQEGCLFSWSDSKQTTTSLASSFQSLFSSLPFTFSLWSREIDAETK